MEVLSRINTQDTGPDRMHPRVLRSSVGITERMCHGRLLMPGERKMSHPSSVPCKIVEQILLEVTSGHKEENKMLGESQQVFLKEKIPA